MPRCKPDPYWGARSWQPKTYALATCALWALALDGPFVDRPTRELFDAMTARGVKDVEFMKLVVVLGKMAAVDPPVIDRVVNAKHTLRLACVAETMPPNPYLDDVPAAPVVNVEAVAMAVGASQEEAAAFAQTITEPEPEIQPVVAYVIEPPTAAELLNDATRLIAKALAVMPLDDAANLDEVSNRLAMALDENQRIRGRLRTAEDINGRLAVSNRDLLARNRLLQANLDRVTKSAPVDDRSFNEARRMMQERPRANV